MTVMGHRVLERIEAALTGMKEVIRESFRDISESQIVKSYVAYEDTDFTETIELDIADDLGRLGKVGHVSNDGEAGEDFVINIDCGNGYGSDYTIKNGEVFDLAGLLVKRIKITHSVNSAYRVFIS